MDKIKKAAKMYLKAERIEYKARWLHDWFIVSKASEDRAGRALVYWRNELKRLANG